MNSAPRDSASSLSPVKRPSLGVARRAALFVGLLLIFSYVGVSILQSKQATLLPAGSSTFVNDHVLGFSEQMTTGFSKEEISEVRTLLTNTRNSALAKAQTAVLWRDSLQIGSHVSAGAALIASLIVALLGSARGVTLSTPPTNDELASLGKGARSTRQWILAIAALSAFCITTSDRLTVYATDAGTHAAKIVQSIKSADDAASIALNPEEVRSAAHTLETNLIEM